MACLPYRQARGACRSALRQPVRLSRRVGGLRPASARIGGPSRRAAAYLPPDCSCMTLARARLTRKVYVPLDPGLCKHSDLFKERLECGTFSPFWRYFAH